MSERVFYVNGGFCPPDRAQVSVLDRAFLMGDAVYEVMRVHKGVPVLTREHHDRMSRGLGELGIPVPFTQTEFHKLCADLVARNHLTAGLVYLQVTRGAAERTHLVPGGLLPNVVGFVSQPELPRWKAFPGGVKAITVPDERWVRCDLKTTMLLANSLAKQKAKDAGAFEAILVSGDGIVREGTSTSLLAVWNGALHGHPDGPRILPGITRRKVAEIARQDGVPFVEETFTMEGLLAADEVILTGTTTDVCPVVEVDGARIGDGRVGPVARRLIHAYTVMLDAAAEDRPA